jgi:hypothetical protein
MFKNENDFKILVDKAYGNGWTYSTFTSEIWTDYNNRCRHFEQYLYHLKNNKSSLETVKILIGEAPPFYRATKESNERAYFYSPEETGSSPWFSAPLVHFVGKKKNNLKQNKLYALAEKGILLLDVFPFPIIQDTEMRMDITGEFAEHLKTYFLPFVKSVIEYLELESEKIEWGIAATKYAGTQLMLGENSRVVLENGIKDFFESPITKKITGEIAFKSYLKFHDDSKESFSPSNNSLNLSIWSSSKKKKAFSPYFVFVVTLLNAKLWIEYVEQKKVEKSIFSAYTFTSKQVGVDVEKFLIAINQKLREKKMLPIFSTFSGGISFNDKAFFNSHKVLIVKKKVLKK